MTAFLVVRDGDDAVTLASVEPRQSVAHVADRPGARHPVVRGAPWVALHRGHRRTRSRRRRRHLFSIGGHRQLGRRLIESADAIAAELHES